MPWPPPRAYCTCIVQCSDSDTNGNAGAVRVACTAFAALNRQSRMDKNKKNRALVYLGANRAAAKCTVNGT